MYRMLCIWSVWCLTAALPLVLTAQENRPATGATAASVTSAASDPCPLNIDPQVAAASSDYVWRVRAYGHLDCMVAILDRALGAKGADMVTLTREDAARLRTLAFDAKDAAARIGR